MTYRPLRGLATWSIALTVVFLVSTSLLYGLDVAAHFTAPGWAGFATEPDEPAEIAFLLGMFVVVLPVIGSAIAAGVVFLVWTHRALNNLRALGVQGTRMSPGWAVGWWFIPFANLVMPFLGLKEAAVGSRRGVYEFDRSDSDTPGVLAGFWACWILANVLSSIDLRNSPTPGGTLANVSIVFLVSSWVVQVIGTVCFIALTLRVTADQQAKRETGGTDGLYTCTSCGYDLRGTRGPLCPECGTPVPAAHREQWERRVATAATPAEPWS